MASIPLPGVADEKAGGGVVNDDTASKKYSFPWTVAEVRRYIKFMSDPFNAAREIDAKLLAEEQERKASKSQKGPTENPPKVPVISVQGTTVDPPPVSRPVTRMKNVLVTRVISPHEFYCVLQEDRDGPFVETHNHIKFQNFCNRQEYNRKAEYIVSPWLYKCYALCDQRTGIWYRVRLVGYNHYTETAQVHYFDIGLMEFVSCSKLRNLPDEFTKDARPVWRCFLEDVAPARGGYYWTLPEIVFFKNLVLHKELEALPMSWSGKRTYPNSTEGIIDVGLTLFGRTEEQLENVTSVNWLLVEMGIARSLGVAASSTQSLFLEGCVPAYEFDREPWRRSLVETYCVEQDENRRDLTPSFPLPDWSYSGCMPLVARNRLAWIHMSYVEGPDCIFVQSEYMRAELDALHADLQREMMESLVKSEFEILPGLEVCCEVKDDPARASGTWCRGVVYKNDPTKGKARVILADFGSIIKVNHKRIHMLPDKFRRIPSYAHRVHLSSIRPKEDTTWSLGVKEEFSEYINLFEKDGPYYFAYRPGYKYNTTDDIIQLDHVRQGIQFDVGKSKWVAAPQEFDEEDVLMMAELQKNPMLTSHFSSIMVEIVYEFPSQYPGFWEFVPVHDDLVSEGRAAAVVQDVDKESYFRGSVFQLRSPYYERLDKLLPI